MAEPLPRGEGILSKAVTGSEDKVRLPMGSGHLRRRGYLGQWRGARDGLGSREGEAARRGCCSARAGRQGGVTGPPVA